MIDHLVIFQILLTLGREFEPAAQAILDLFIFYSEDVKQPKICLRTGTLSISRLILFVEEDKRKHDVKNIC